MVEKISKKILKVLVNDTDASEEKKEILLFGIIRFVEDIPKTIGIILIALLLGMIYEFAIITLILMLYKTFIGGVHVKTNMGCFIYSVLFYLAIVYSAKYMYFNSNTQHLIYLLMYIFAIYVIWVYVPADVPEIPKINEKLRKRLKRLSFIMLNILYLSIILLNNKELINIVMYSIFYINLMAIRSIYKMLNVDYGFEKYIPEQII